MTRIRLERLLQIAARDFDLRLDFSDKDRVGSGQIVVGISPEAVAHSEYRFILGHSLHLLGHSLEGSLDWVDAIRREEDAGKPFLSSLWHALEDARLENVLIRRWPGARRALDARLPPNLGDPWWQLMDSTRQIELGLYPLRSWDGRSAVRPRMCVQALEAVKVDIDAGVHGDSPRASLDASLQSYPHVAHLLRAEHVGGPGPRLMQINRSRTGTARKPFRSR